MVEQQNMAEKTSAAAPQGSGKPGAEIADPIATASASKDPATAFRTKARATAVETLLPQKGSDTPNKNGGISPRNHPGKASNGDPSSTSAATETATVTSNYVKNHLKRPAEPQNSSAADPQNDDDGPRTFDPDTLAAITASIDDPEMLASLASMDPAVLQSFFTSEGEFIRSSGSGETNEKVVASNSDDALNFDGPMIPPVPPAALENPDIYLRPLYGPTFNYARKDDKISLEARGHLRQQGPIMYGKLIQTVLSAPAASVAWRRHRLSGVEEIRDATHAAIAPRLPSGTKPQYDSEGRLEVWKGNKTNEKCFLEKDDLRGSVVGLWVGCDADDNSEETFDSSLYRIDFDGQVFFTDKSRPEDVARAAGVQVGSSNAMASSVAAASAPVSSSSSSVVEVWDASDPTAGKTTTSAAQRSTSSAQEVTASRIAAHEKQPVAFSCGIDSENNLSFAIGFDPNIYNATPVWTLTNDAAQAGDVTRTCFVAATSAQCKAANNVFGDWVVTTQAQGSLSARNLDSEGVDVVLLDRAHNLLSEVVCS